MPTLPRSAFLFACLLGSALGCTTRMTPTPVVPGADGGADGGTPSTGEGLRIEPADLEASLADGPVTVDYRALLRAADGTERDVSAEVGWVSTVPALGAFSGSVFTSVGDRGGRTNIRASMGALVATTSLTLRFDSVIVTPGAPADAPSRFEPADDAAITPEVVYPDDDAVVPPNLGELEFHYRTAGATVFELALSTPSSRLRMYFGCPEAVAEGCIFTPDRAAWEAFATAAQGQGPVNYTLRGALPDGRVGTSGIRRLTVAEEPIRGGLYYWNAGGGTIDRFEFGVPGARAERFLDRGRTGASTCVGCHALSRDGRRIAVGTDIPTTTLQVFDVASRTRLWSLGSSGGFGGFPQQPNFQSFSPDASLMASSALAGLSIRDGNTGTVVEGPLGGGPASMPDFSPDGQHIVFARHDAPAFGGLADTPGITGGRIVRLDRTGSGWTLGPTLAMGGGNNYYPSYSPDGRWVLFVRSPSNTSSMGADPDSGMSGVPDAQLWFVGADGGTPQRIGRAAGLADSWPKWDPSLYEDRDRPLFWVSWSSRRAFGLRYAADTKVQLWMAAFDPAEAEAGRDPLRPAFRLPFQDIETGNHIAQWVTTVERQTCTTNADCGGEFCIDGRCYEQTPLF